LGVDVDGALIGVDVGGLQRIVLDVPVGVHENGDLLVALVGVGLGLEDLLVDGELPPGEVRVPVEDLVPDHVPAPAGNHAGGGDGARVHHGVHLRSPVLLDGVDGVEHLAGGVHAHVVLDGVRTLLLHDQGHGEGLGDGLDGDLGGDVAGGVDLAV